MRFIEPLAWLALACFAGATVWWTMGGVMLNPSYAIEIDHGIAELLAGPR